MGENHEQQKRVLAVFFNSYISTKLKKNLYCLPFFVYNR